MTRALHELHTIDRTLAGHAMAELLEWHDVRSRMPDRDITVLAWVRGADGTSDWCSAWWDGEQWIDCASGGVVERCR